MKYLRPKIHCVFAVVFLLCANTFFSTSTFSCAFAQEKSESQDTAADEADVVDVAEEISKIKTTLRKQITSLTAEYKSAEDQKAQNAVVAKRRAMELTTIQSVIELVENRDDERRNIRDLVWFLNRTKGEARTLIHDSIIPKYAKSEYMTEFVRAVGKVSSPSPENEAWLRELIEISPSDKVKGNATWTLVEYIEKLQLASNSLRGFGRDPLELFEEKDGEVQPTEKGSELNEEMGGPQFAQYKTLWKSLAGRDEAILNSEIESLLTICRDKYPDVKKGRNKIGKLAATKLNLSNLKVGKIAPDIVGEDLDGVAFKLSDYRGKVVMIDFWGDW
ncbi:MAG: hypothetical protein AB8B55_15705 [Mariniblastus sp.]